MTRLHASLGILLTACASTPAAPVESFLGEEPLGASEVSGITVDHLGTRFLLTRDGRVEARIDGIWEERFVAPPGEYHDIAHVRDSRFAITTTNAGLGLDLENRLLQPYFCYVPVAEVVEDPRPVVDVPTEEVAYAVTYDARRDLLVAQPQTREVESGRPVFSELALFRAFDGEEQLFRNLNDADFAAEGIVVITHGLEELELLLGEGTTLHVSTMPDVTRRRALDLASLGVREIRGLAVDPIEDVLLVADQRGDEAYLVSLDLSAVLEAL
ncbi:MAG: hypothetical protein H6722_11785 [Sandaracinus sp.]|nr:hypothetical protein [Sandaracinus sp.]MCB9613125.1 hypothetical protein [Sandaracinus sp.]